MILVSLWLFFSGMGEGLILMFPVALLGSTILVIHSVITHKKWLQIVAVIILVFAISLVVSMALGLFS